MAPYKFSTTIEVRFKDVDSLGHVNNAVYLTYFEIAAAPAHVRVARERDE